jgi:hypothetical protein
LDQNSLKRKDKRKGKKKLVLMEEMGSPFGLSMLLRFEALGLPPLCLYTSKHGSAKKAPLLI